MTNQNILSSRYASDELNYIFSERGKTIAERELWLAVLKGQMELGVSGILAEDIEKFEKAKEDIDLKRIAEIEAETRHDVKAKIQGYVEAAKGKQILHRGMTSRDLTDNVEQMQIKNAAQFLFGKYVSVARHLMDKALEYQDIVLTARTHHQPAQPTVLGRRFSMWAEALQSPLLELESFIENYPLRGIKGPVGTQFDMVTVLGSEEKVEELEKRVAEHLGFSRTLKSPGQVYPRTLDYQFTSKLAACTTACTDFAVSMRLMAGYELVTEGFKEGQVGSSAMPHKMNTRSSERICGFGELIKMYDAGAGMNAGKQWEEGDVSCSVPRRVIIPDICYASDGLCETTLTVLNEMGPYPEVISREVDKYLPFLATTEILMTAAKAGIGREDAHALIKKYAKAEALRLRAETNDEMYARTVQWADREMNNPTGIVASNNRLAYSLSQDSVFKKAGITEQMLNESMKDKVHFVGRAVKQIKEVYAILHTNLLSKYPAEAKYEPGDIL